MTTLSHSSKVCSVCGTVTAFHELMSTNSFGYSDLDFRPAEMKRSTMMYWAQECPHCGYVSYDISEPPSDKEDLQDFLQSEDYLHCAGIPIKSSLGKRFFRHYLLLFKAGQLDKALSSIHAAAWCCDDNRESKNAHDCRLLALELLSKLAASDSVDTHRKEIYALLRADFLRRTNQFDQVIKEYTNTHFTTDDGYNTIATYQVELSKLKDNTCHSAGDAFGKTPE